MQKVTLLLLFVFCISSSIAQESEQLFGYEKWKNKKWEAQWIGPTNHSAFDYAVQLFRKKIELTDVPDKFIVHLSADQRYEFFVNGISVDRGPAAGYLMGWNYETLDISKHLKKGKNILAASVVNYGSWTPGAQQTIKTAFILQGEDQDSKTANTDRSWKTITNLAYKPNLVGMEMLDIEPGDVISGGVFPWGWQTLSFDDGSWYSASEQGRGQPVGSATEYRRALQPRLIPMAEIKDENPLIIRSSEGIELSGQLLEHGPLTVPANSHVRILLDQGYLTNAFVGIQASGGLGAHLLMTYAESLYYPNGDKGNRNIVVGKSIKGAQDKFEFEGGDYRIYQPLNFKTFRYIEVQINTMDAPLTIHNFKNQFVGYPFELKAKFKTDNPLLEEIFSVGWRTARLCAVDTYYDCPYYERLQYTGDTRIQGLISLYMSGDDRLMRKAITDIASSMVAEGILQSRYPAHYPQIIPPFSLYWVNMLHDYYMHNPDEDFVKLHLPTVKRILAWFENHIDTKTGLLGPLPHWNFVDWPNEWPWSDDEPIGGVPPGVLEGGSAIISLQLAYTLGDAISLFKHFGYDHDAKNYTKLKKDIGVSAMASCFNYEKGLMADHPNSNTYSQHASIMGILSDAIPAKLQQNVFHHLITDPTLTQATVYYQFYLTRAMKKVNLADMYVSRLATWENMLGIGLTTFAERPEPSRSDCHAWSASPNYDFLATICGIEPELAGFKKVSISPNPGKLSILQATMPHPNGTISIDLKMIKGELRGEIVLPKEISGTYKFGNRKQFLSGGKNYIK